jgi:hypothetical protein
MHSPLAEFLRKAGVRNLYLLHLDRQAKTGLYSLSDPIIKPEETVTTYFHRTSRPSVNPDAEFSKEMMGVQGKSRRDFFS